MDYVALTEIEIRQLMIQFKFLCGLFLVIVLKKMILRDHVREWMQTLGGSPLALM